MKSIDRIKKHILPVLLFISLSALTAAVGYVGGIGDMVYSDEQVIAPIVVYAAAVAICLFAAVNSLFAYMAEKRQRMKFSSFRHPTDRVDDAKVFLRAERKSVLFFAYFIFISAVFIAVYIFSLAILAKAFAYRYFFFLQLSIILFSFPYFYELLFLVVNSGRGRGRFCLTSGEYETFLSMAREIEKETDIDKTIKIYLDYGFVRVDVLPSEVAVYIGIDMLFYATTDELKAAIKREIISVSGKGSQKYDSVIKRMIFFRRFSLGAGYGYLCFINKRALNYVDYGYSVDSVSLYKERERKTDALFASSPDARLYLAAYKKYLLRNAFQYDERCGINGKLFADPQNAVEYPAFLNGYFIECYHTYGERWLRFIAREKDDPAEPVITFAEKLKIYGVPDPEPVFPDARPDDFNLTIENFSRENYENMRETYFDKKEQYDNIDARLLNYEDGREIITGKQALLDVASDYRLTGRFEKALEIYEKLISEGDRTPRTLCDAGTLLIALGDKRGVGYICDAAEMRPLSFDDELVSARKFAECFCDEDEEREFSERRKEIYRRSSEIYNDTLTPGMKTSECTLVKNVTEKIKKFIIEDDNVTKIYFFDMKTKGRPLSVIGLKFRNSMPDAVEESWRRVAVEVQNEYFEYNLCVIPLDNSPFFKKTTVLDRYIGYSAE